MERRSYESGIRYRHLDTSFLDVDVQPKYVRVTIKQKILQLTLSCEVLTERSSVQRSQITGHLTVTMPRLNPLKVIEKPIRVNPKTSDRPVKSMAAKSLPSRREFLEIGPEKYEFDYTKIVARNEIDDNKQKNKSSDRREVICLTKEKIPSDNFMDNPEVPPLL